MGTLISRKNDISNQQAILLAKEFDALRFTIDEIAKNNINDVKKGSDLYLQNGLTREAIKYCMENEEYRLALNIAQQHAPELVEKIQGYISSHGGMADNPAPNSFANNNINSNDEIPTKENALKIIQSGERCERNQDHISAISHYLSLNENYLALNNLDKNILFKAWDKAFRLVQNFNPEQTVQVGQLIAKNYRNAKEYNRAAKISIQLEDYETGIIDLCSGKEFSKAKRVATQIQGISEESRRRFIAMIQEMQMEAENNRRNPGSSGVGVS